jgi:hypothetical protein
MKYGSVTLHGHSCHTFEITLQSKAGPESQLASTAAADAAEPAYDGDLVSNTCSYGCTCTSAASYISMLQISSMSRYPWHGRTKPVATRKKLHTDTLVGAFIRAPSKMLLLFDNRSALLEVAKDRKVMLERHSGAAAFNCC